ncbi:conserved hypothetical protein [Flavobacterium psychrophilum]|uniref:hypothetical protein n=2 Tax=Flavobacterium psychrophilum TaxID=96345 RepID=UPI000B7C0FA7|nr:hypothetical protein [Flavobacterium psychrophilum]MCB6060704.1 hypothetical protein [Flavobacterium psychrophilum]SNB42112.1 conserved hypothetical protein [Flavobacterium psychrophilum]
MNIILNMLQKYNICNKYILFFHTFMVNNLDIYLMILKRLKKVSKKQLLLVVFSVSLSGFSQDFNNVRSKSGFWKKVQIGGGLGLNVGGGFTNIAIAPSAIYNINDYFSLGVGLQGSYVSVKSNYDSFIYGGSLIGLIHPIEQIQLSVELEELRVNTTFESSFRVPSRDFWNTGLFLGAGYRANNVTIGARYNVLYHANDNVYNDAFMPFIRFYF